MKLSIALLIPVLALSMSSVSAQHGHRDASAHVHGASQLSLVQDRLTLLIEFETPAINIVGFEHAPQHEAEHDAIKSALLQLQEPDSILRLSALNCELVQSHAAATGQFTDISANHGGDDHSHARSHTHSHAHSHAHSHVHSHASNEHAGFRVIFELQCDNESTPAEMAVTAFRNFAGLEAVDVQWALSRTQGAQRLSRPQSNLRLR